MSYLVRYHNPYMGFAVAAAAPIAAATGPLAPFVLAAAAVATVLPFLSHIGAGRKEADAIGPEQEKFGQALGQLDQILSSQTLDASQLQDLRNQLVDMWQRYNKFVYDPVFTADGDTRASDQSIATLQPMYQSRLDHITAMINAVLGRPQVPAMLQGAGTPSLEFRTVTDQVLPQAGFLTPGAVAPRGPQVIAPISNDNLLWKLAAAAAVVYVVSR